MSKEKLNKEMFKKHGKVWTTLDMKTRLKDSSLQAYTQALKTICEYADLADPFELVGGTANEIAKLDRDQKEKLLEHVEDLTEEWIRGHENKYAPKYLNVVYCAVKTWCKIMRLMKTRKMFREIDFDKSSRKKEALTEAMFTADMLKMGFDMVTIAHKVDLGLYALNGVRPVLIPQLKMIVGEGRCGFHKRSAHIEQGKLVIDRKPAIMIITRVDESGVPRRGNKGNITFFVLVPTKLCELIETFVNSRAQATNTPVTADTRLADSKDDKQVYWKAKEFYRKIGFKGRPYLLRKYADRINDAITREAHDEDFKEFLMGHKGKISAIYQVAGLTEEDETKFRDMYIAYCDGWINEHIFGTVTKEQKTVAQALSAYAVELGVPVERVAEMQKILEVGKMTFEQFDKQLTKLTRKAFDRKVDERIEAKVNAMLEKRA